MIASQLTHSHPSWKHPRNDLSFLKPEFYQNIGRVLERGKFDFVFFADGLMVPSRYGAGIEDTLRRGSQGAVLLDPAYVVATMATATEHLGLGITRSTTYYSPYDMARTFATLDHLSGGRIAWNVVTSHNTAEARNFGQDEHMAHERRYDRADEFLEVTYKLWDSWQDDALILDKQKGIFADPTKVRHIHHEGEWFRSQGPLSIPRSPQGRPVIMQAGSSNRGREFAARWAEILFLIEPDPKEIKAFYQDVKSRMGKYGRDPNELKILPTVMPFVGETEAIAQEKYNYHHDLVDPIAGLQTLSSHMDHDFSQYDLDAPVQNVQVGGIKGLFEIAVRLSKSDGLTLRDIGKLYGAGVLVPPVVGTGPQIADHLEAIFKDAAADGFIISPAFLPGAFEEFVEFVVPELQQRGLFRKEYEAKTLRDHLELGKASLTPPQLIQQSVGAV
ncbi:LLM class flavin-dependent oxidoreductase [Leptolyngbya sp. PL-A3]